MSDDEVFGRAWCAANRKHPDPDGGKFYWACTGAMTMQKLPDILFERLAGPFPLCVGYDTEAEAFAAIGKAVRAIHAEVPPLKGQA